jgi:flagellar secretion chaperone FliS
MNQNQIASEYRQMSARGSNPVGFVVKLYDAILEDFRRALDAIAEGNVERRTNSLNHALLVIAELEGVLDHDRGGKIAKQLQGFYGVTRAMIVEANIAASREKLQKLVGLYIPLRQAWHLVEQDVATGKVVLPGRSDAPAPQTRQNAPIAQPKVAERIADSDGPQSDWSA